MIDQPATEHRPCCGHYSTGARPYPDCPTALAFVKRCPEHGQTGRGQQGRTKTLDCAASDEHGNVRRKPASDRSEREDCKSESKNPAPTKKIGRSATDQDKRSK